MTDLTSYQAKYIAYELTRRFPSGSSEKFNVALMDAQVDLNPHQVEAALFAFKSPLSKGGIIQPFTRHGVNSFFLEPAVLFRETHYLHILVQPFYLQAFVMTNAHILQGPYYSLLQLNAPRNLHPF